MAMLRGAYMAPDADNVRAAMARAAEAAFDRLAKQQVGGKEGRCAVRVGTSPTLTAPTLPCQDTGMLAQAGFFIRFLNRFLV